MKKIFYSLCILFLVLNLNYLVFAQTKFTAQVIGGYSVPLGDLRTDITGSWTDSTLFPYALKYGYNFGLVGKLSFGKNENFRLVLGLNYSNLSNSINEPSIYDASTTITFRPKITIFTMTIGGEYSYSIAKNISPFIGADFTGNLFGGSFVFDNSGDSGVYYPTTLNSAFRLGLQFGGGVDFAINKQFGIVAGLKYNLANFMTKGRSDPSQVPSTEIDLADKSYNGSNAKNIFYLQLYAGFTFYFENPKK